MFFAWTYKDLKGIPQKLAQHIIELDIIISSTHIRRKTCIFYWSL